MHVARLHRKVSRQRNHVDHAVSATYAKSHGTVLVSVPLEGPPPNRVPLPAGCYELRVAAYASDDVVSGGDSCTVAYAGPSSSTASVPCRLRFSAKDCR